MNAGLCWGVHIFMFTYNNRTDICLTETIKAPTSLRLSLLCDMHWLLKVYVTEVYITESI